MISLIPIIPQNMKDRPYASKSLLLANSLLIPKYMQKTNCPNTWMVLENMLPVSYEN